MAGSNDFTGQNIQDTYQRVLQLSSSLQLADGTGSLVSFLPISASYAFTSSVEVTKEISSSHANNADTASYIEAANIVQPFTHITASGDISASGRISANNLFLHDGNFDIQTGNTYTFNPSSGTGNIQFNVGVSNMSIHSSGQLALKSNNKILELGSISSPANVTASGEISASGQILATNYRVQGNNALSFHNTHGVGVGTSDQKLKLNSTAITLDAPVTASGDISASGTIIGSNLSGTNTGDQNITNLAVTGSDVIFNHITASGDISSSGDVFARRIIVTGSNGVAGIISASLPASHLGITQASRFGHIYFNGKNKDRITLEDGTGNIHDGAKIQGAGVLGSFYDIISPGTNHFQIGSSVGTIATRISGSTIELNSSGDIFLKPKQGELRLHDDQTEVFRFKMDEHALSAQVNNMFELQANLTASGDISASGAITTAELKGTGTTTGFETSGYISSSQLYIGDSTNYVSASFGNISGSGNISGFTSMSVQYITASRIDVDGDTIKVGGETFNKTLLQNVKDGFSADSRNQGKGSAVFKSGISVSHVTASGQISSSGNVIGLNLTTDSIILGGNRYRTETDNFDIMDGGLEVNGNVTASGDISSSGNIIGNIANFQNYNIKGESFVEYNATADALGIAQATNIKKINIGKSGNNANILLDGSVTASGDISASNEVIGHTFTHNVGYGAGRAFILGGTPQRFYSYSGGDVGDSLAIEDPINAITSTVFVAPYSCSLEQINWSLLITDGTSTTSFPMISRAVKLHAYSDAAGAFLMNAVITPDNNNFEQTYNEGRAYLVEQTYTGSSAALLGPGDSLCLFYSSSAGGKHTGNGMATATFRKI